MSDLSIIPSSVPGDQLCFSVKEFGAAMGAAQGQTIASAGQAMLIFFFVGVIFGAVFVYAWMRCKQEIDAAQSGDED